MKQKINVASNFIYRVMTLSRNSSIQQQKAVIHEHLKSNNYPTTLVNRLIQKQISTATRRLRTNIQTPNYADPLPPQNPDPPPPPPYPDPQSIHHNPAPPLNPDPPLVPSNLIPPLSNTESSPQTTAIPIAEMQIEPSISSTTEEQNQRVEDVRHASNTQQVKLFRSVPYVPMLTERLSKMLQHDYPQYEIANRQHHTVNNFLSKVKDPTNTLDKISVVYKIPCNNCNSCYIGMTNNKLNTRLIGHRSNIKRLDEVISGTNTTTTIDDMREKTALLRHCIESGHRFNLTNTKIVDQSRSVNTLPFLEMCHIYATPHTVNKREDIAGLNTAYASLLTRLKNNSQNTIPSPSTNSQDINPQ